MLKKKQKFIKTSKKINIQFVKPRQIHQNNLHRFSINLNTNQNFLYKKNSSTLKEEWLNLPKNKQKFYYKLYWKLLKSKIYKEEKRKSKSNWVYENHKIPFWMEVKYNKFTSKRRQGYTIYGENVLNFGKTKCINNITNYKKFKIYYNF